MKIELKGLKELAENLDDKAKRQIPFAVMNALRDTAFAARGELQKEITRVFDRPTPFILKSIEVNQRSLSKTNLKVSVWIDPFNTGALESLTPQIFGGQRRVKRSELLLRRLGILPSDKYIAPSQDAFTDAYGNIPGSTMTAILSDLQAFPEVGYSMNRRKGSHVRYFVMKQGSVPIGVFERYSRYNARPVLVFVSRPSYQKRFDFFGVGKNAAYSAFRQNFPRRFREALATAK